jgi:DivIVA domain-containing protein
VTPDEIRQARFEKRLRGYDTGEVDRLLGDLASSFGDLERERNDLRERVTRLEAGLEEHNEVQHLMREALVSAQRTADELHERTQQECDELLRQARVDAETITAEARGERARAEEEIEKLRAQERELRASYRVLLHAALDRLGESGGGEVEGGGISLLDALAPRRTPTPEPPEAPQSSGSADDADEHPDGVDE